MSGLQQLSDHRRARVIRARFHCVDMRTEIPRETKGPVTEGATERSVQIDCRGLRAHADHCVHADTGVEESACGGGLGCEVVQHGLMCLRERGIGESDK